MRKYSISQLADFELCPWRALRNRQGYKGVASHPLMVGSLFHKWAEMANEGWLSMRAEAMAALVDAAEEVEADALALEDCKNIAASWLDARMVDRRLPVAGVREWQFGFDLLWRLVGFDGAATRIRGAVDYHEIQGRQALVLDYKTGHLIPNPIKWDQLMFYAFAVAEAHPEVQRFTLVYDFARTGWQPSITVSREDLQVVPAQLQKQMQRADKMLDSYLETGHMEARVNQFCGHCAHRTTCPVLNEIMGLRSVNPTLLPAACVKDAEATAATIKLLTAALEDTKAVMKQWTTEDGPVKGQEGKQWETRTHQRDGRPIQTLREYKV